MFRLLIFAFVGYILYRLFTRVLIPAFRLIRKAQKRANEVNQHMNAQRQSQYHQKKKGKTSAQDEEGEYIDYEEVD